MKLSSDSSEFLAPGTVIQLDEITQMRPLENAIAMAVRPDMTPMQQYAWNGRSDIVDAVRPLKFNGRMVDIELAVMEDAYDRLLDAKDRGWKLGAGNGYKLSQEWNLDKVERYVGLALVANARSSGRGIIGQVQTELWYYPIPDSLSSQVRKDGTVRFHTNTAKYAGTSVRRVITKPKLETEKFRELDETARRIGFNTLRDAMLNSITTPHRG